MGTILLILSGICVIVGLGCARAWLAKPKRKAKYDRSAAMRAEMPYLVPPKRLKARIAPFLMEKK